MEISGDATTFPLRDGGLSGDTADLRRPSSRSGASELADRSTGVWVAAVALGAIVVLSIALVAMAANRPSILAPTTHIGYFPRWMAGPLGGVAPWLPRGSTALKYMFTGAIVLMFVSYLAALTNVRALRARWVIGAIVAAHVIFFLSPPLALTDIFNYVNYGRMEVVHHLNPYTTIPIIEPHDDPSYALSNWHQLLSPYGPLFTLVTFAVVPLGVAASFWALKALLALTSLATILLVWKIARLLGRDPLPAVVLVGLNPVVLVWGLGGDHNDFLMVLFIMLGFYLLLLARARAQRTPAVGGAVTGVGGAVTGAQMAAGAALAVAVGIKASAAVLIPVVLAGVVRDRGAVVRVLLGMLAAGVVVAAASVLAFGLHIPDLSTQSKLVTGESVPNLIGLALGAGGESETLHKLMDASLIACIALCCWQAYSRRWPASDRMLTGAGWASVALLVTLSWVLPWYVLWALPLAALSSSRRLRGAAIVLSVYLIVAWAPASGLLWSAINFYPEKTTLGRLHHRYVRELLN